MATTSKMEYKKIKVTGPVSVERVDRVQYSCWRVLVMGPTGAGKSSFIEALGLKGSSKISSNGLDGCTQAVTTYKLNNVADGDGDPIYLVDSPSFADTKISEIAIVSMLQKWVKDNRAVFSRILYLMPITSVWLPGSQRQVLKTFHALTGAQTAANVMIVTTMWDTVWGEHASKRAQENYQQLQSNIWKDFIQEGARMTQFHNMKESTLSILDEVLASGSEEYASLEDHQRSIKGSPFKANLLTDLHNRIQNLQSHIPTLHDEIAHAEAKGDELLLSTLRPRIKEAQDNLERFQKELKGSGLLAPPPSRHRHNLRPRPPRPIATLVPDSEVHSTSPQGHTTRGIQRSENLNSALPQDPQPTLHSQQAVRLNNTPNFSLSPTPLSLPPPINQIGTVPDVPPIAEVVTSSIPPPDAQHYVPPTDDIAITGISRSVEEDVRAVPQQPTLARSTPGVQLATSHFLDIYPSLPAFFLVSVFCLFSAVFLYVYDFSLV